MMNFNGDSSHINEETIQEAKETADHINMINWEEFDTGEDFGTDPGATQVPADDIVTPEEFYSDMFSPIFKTMSTVSGYNTFATASENRNASKIIYKKIANNKFTRFILQPGTQNYIDTLHLLGFIASIVFGLATERKAKQALKKKHTQSETVATENEQQEDHAPVVKTNEQTEEDIEYVPEVA